MNVMNIVNITKYHWQYLDLNSFQLNTTKMIYGSEQYLSISTEGQQLLCLELCSPKKTHNVYRLHDCTLWLLTKYDNPRYCSAGGCCFEQLFTVNVLRSIDLDDQVIVSSLTHEGYIKEKKKNKSKQTWQK